MRIPRFDTKAERFAYIKANKAEIIKAKKSEVKALTGDECTDFKLIPSKIMGAVSKGEDTETELQRTIIGNTYYWLDEHDDVHVKGTFTKSISENIGKIPHRHDHLNQLAAKVGIFSSVYEKNIKWKDLGVNEEGDTISLFGDSTIKKAYNPSIFEQYKDNEIDQHSVGMIYMDLIYCSDDVDDEDAHKGWLLYIELLGNKDKAKENGYFFIILQAKLIEISCVTRGSNELTPTLESKAELLENLENVLGKENSVLLLNALEKNEPLDLTLKTIKPQSKKKSVYLKL